jgi:hypothetical protein
MRAEMARPAAPREGADAGTSDILTENLISHRRPGQQRRNGGSCRTVLSPSDAEFAQALCAARRRAELRGDIRLAGYFSRMVAKLRRVRRDTFDGSESQNLY